MKNFELALSFDDILLVPLRSEVTPREINVNTFLTQRIRLGIPIISAAMDTVTEAPLAIALAREGGIGIVHRRFGIDEQATEVGKVKRSESGIIRDPVTLSPDLPVRRALELVAEFKISGVPITRHGKLLGILTARDLRFVDDLESPVSKFMTKSGLVTAPQGISLEKAKKMLREKKIEKLPIVDSKGNLKGLITLKDMMKEVQFPNAAKDELGRLRVGAAIGAIGDYEERAAELVKAHVDALVIDSAHGHSVRVMKAVKRLKKLFPSTDVIAGNVATGEAARDLIKAGADGIKVGVGPGASCTTRVVTGAGVPQLTAVMECASAAREAGTPVISDGGIRYSGDMTKALAGGASSVMIGNLFAGAQESPGDVVLLGGRSYKIYRGMGSLGALFGGPRDRYFQERETKFVPEGVEGRVPFKGDLALIVYQLIGGLKAGMGYVGAKNIDELRKKARFVRVTRAGLREGHPHDIFITKEAPNYGIS
ncbi:MAG: IMP dehydrogenase [Candidatus Eisenbacteria bacterium]|nr:IMP dehydrogenase [Candidatus Eisenbacteria bacterium]